MDFPFERNIRSPLLHCFQRNILNFGHADARRANRFHHQRQAHLSRAVGCAKQAEVLFLSTRGSFPAKSYAEALGVFPCNLPSYKTAKPVQRRQFPVYRRWCILLVKQCFFPIDDNHLADGIYTSRKYFSIVASLFSPPVIACKTSLFSPLSPASFSSFSSFITIVLYIVPMILLFLLRLSRQGSKLVNWS